MCTLVFQAARAVHARVRAHARVCVHAHSTLCFTRLHKYFDQHCPTRCCSRTPYTANDVTTSHWCVRWCVFLKIREFQDCADFIKTRRISLKKSDAFSWNIQCLPLAAPLFFRFSSARNAWFQWHALGRYEIDQITRGGGNRQLQHLCVLQLCCFVGAKR